MRSKAGAGALVAGVVLLFLAAFAASGFADSAQCTTEQELGKVRPASETPLDIVVQLKSADLSKGVELRVTFQNRGPGPSSLDVCPAMLLCCVRGLHPMISCEEAGVGLLDACVSPNPTNREVFLPANAAFSFDLTIPAERIPEPCRKKGKKISVRFCYEASDEALIHSNVIEAVLN